MLFRFAVAAGVTGAFSAARRVGSFFVLALGGAVVGVVVGTAWVKLVRRLRRRISDHRSHGAAVLDFLSARRIAACFGRHRHRHHRPDRGWHQHTVLSASTRMRGTSFWTVMVFLMEAAVFMLIGLSLRDVVERGGGFGVVIATMGLADARDPARARGGAFCLGFRLRSCRSSACGPRAEATQPLGAGGATVLSWAGVRGVITLALALSLPEGFPGRDFILVTSFAVILGTVLVQGTTLGRVIAWARLAETETEKARLTMSQAEAAMAQAQLGTVQSLAYDADGQLIHPQLLERYQRKATVDRRLCRENGALQTVLHAHFDVVLEAVAAGRRGLIRLHRAGDIDDETLDELERDLDLEELSAISAKA